MKTTRRNFIKGVAGASAAAAVGGYVSACSDAAAERNFPFAKNQRECLVAVMEQMIPADEDFGGATQAGCINFLENWVERYHPEQLEAFRAAADGADAACVAQHSRRFAELDSNAQIAFMKKWESGAVKDEFFGKFKAVDSFNKILGAAMMGFYGSPRHGGNKDFMSYRMMGIEAPLLIGQNRYNAPEDLKGVKK